MSNQYSIYWKKSAEKDLLDLELALRKKLFSIVDGLSVNPLPPKACKIKTSDNLYRLRVGSYRIIYLLDKKDKVILIYHVRHRKDAYR